MKNVISVFSGIDPLPKGETDWMTVLKNIQSEKYRPYVEKARTLISDPAAYRKYKTCFPSVTFCGNFTKRRNCQNILSSTGFLIPDLDHLSDVEKTFNLLSRDSYIWFCFRSPSGDGLKCALRSEGINTDDDIKVFYGAVERYFQTTYGIKIDPACKDIARLTFVSHDPHLFINKSPEVFPIKDWGKQEEQRFYLPPSTDNGWKSKYGMKVLEGSCEKIRQSTTGAQHRERLKQSRLIGGFIATGFIEEAVAMLALEQAVKDSGAKLMGQAMETVKDGIEYGKQTPIQPEERQPIKKHDDIQYYCDPDEAFRETPAPCDNVDNVDNVDSADSCGQLWTPCGHLVDSCGQTEDSKTSKAPFNLASEIKQWIEESTGYFTCDQIDREFGLCSRQDKKNRSTILARAINQKLIKKDRSVPGKFQIIDPTLKRMDIINTDIDPFDITLPFDLHKYCEVPKKGIVVIAGSKNAGKTALILNIVRANLKKQHKTFYLASEMGPNETKKRLLKFDDMVLENWLDAEFIERPDDHGSVIESHNPDGLTLIDYLEETEGEYYKITSKIRAIYDSLNTGVAVIGIQKHTESDYARGGQGTTEKSRLYLSIDAIGLVGNDQVSAIKVMNIKNWVRKNLQWHELHFKIKHGAEIEPLTDWMPCSTVNRKVCLAQYQSLSTAKDPEKKKEQMQNWTFIFQTETGESVGLKQKDLESWIDAYPAIDVMEELEDIANWSFKEKKLKKKSWFIEVSAILRKRNTRKGNS